MAEPLSLGIIKDAQEVQVSFDSAASYYTFFSPETFYLDFPTQAYDNSIKGSTTLYNPPQKDKPDTLPLNSTKFVAPEKQWGNAPPATPWANSTVPNLTPSAFNYKGQQSWSYSPTAFCVSYGEASYPMWGGRANSILTTRNFHKYNLAWSARPEVYTHAALSANDAKIGAHIESVVPKLTTPRWWRRCGIQHVTSELYGSRSFYILTDALSRFYVYPVGLSVDDVDSGWNPNEYYVPTTFLKQWDFPFANYGLEAPTPENSYALNSNLYESSTFKSNTRPVFVWGHMEVDSTSSKSSPTSYDDWAGTESGFSSSKPLNSAHYVWSFNYNATRATTVAYKLSDTQRTMQGVQGDAYPMYRFKDCPYGYAVPEFMATKINNADASAMHGEGVDFSRDNRTLVPCKDSLPALLEVGIAITLTGTTLREFDVVFSVTQAKVSDESNYYVSSGYTRPLWSDDWKRIINGNGLAWTTIKLSGDDSDLSGYKLTDTVFSNNNEKVKDLATRAGTSTTWTTFFTDVSNFFLTGSQDLLALYAAMVPVLPSIELKDSSVSGDFWACPPAKVSEARVEFKTDRWGSMLKIPIDTMLEEYEIYAGETQVDPSEVDFKPMHSLAWHLVNDTVLIKYISAQIAVNLSRDDYVQASYDVNALPIYFGNYYYAGVTINGNPLRITKVTHPDSGMVFDGFPEILSAFQGYALESLYFINSTKEEDLKGVFDGPLAHFYSHNKDIIFRLLQLAVINKALKYSELEDQIIAKFMGVYFQFMFTGSTEPLNLKLEFPSPTNPSPTPLPDYANLYLKNLYQQWSISTVDGYLVSNTDTLRMRYPLVSGGSNTLSVDVAAADRTKRFMATSVTLPTISAELVYTQAQSMEAFGRKIYDFKACLCGYETIVEYDKDTDLPTGNTPVVLAYTYKLVESDYVVGRTSLDLMGNHPEITKEDTASFGKPFSLPPDTDSDAVDIDCNANLKTEIFDYTTLAFKGIQSKGDGGSPCETYWAVSAGFDFHINVKDNTTTNVIAAHDFANGNALVYSCRANENFKAFSLGSARMAKGSMVEGAGGAVASNIITSASGASLSATTYALLHNWVHANFFGSDFYVPKSWLGLSLYATNEGAESESLLNLDTVPDYEYHNRGYFLGPTTAYVGYSFLASDTYGSTAGYLTPPEGTLQVIASVIPSTDKRKAAITNAYTSALTLDFVSVRSRKGSGSTYYNTTHNDLFNKAFKIALSEPRKYLYYCDVASAGVGSGFATAGGFYGFKLPNEDSTLCDNLKKEW